MTWVEIIKALFEVQIVNIGGGYYSFKLGFGVVALIVLGLIFIFWVGWHF